MTGYQQINQGQVVHSAQGVQSQFSGYTQSSQFSGHQQQHGQVVQQKPQQVDSSQMFSPTAIPGFMRNGK